MNALADLLPLVKRQFINVWDSGFHAVDSGFVFSGTLIPNSNISGIRDSLS